MHLFRSWFDPRLVHTRFVIGKIVSGRDFLRIVKGFLPISSNPSVPQTCISLIFHRQRIKLASHSAFPSLVRKLTSWYAQSHVKYEASCCHVSQNVEQYFYPLLGAFPKLQKQLLASSWLSVCPRRTTRFPLDGFQLNLIFQYFSIKSNGKVHPCTGTEAVYRPYGP